MRDQTVFNDLFNDHQLDQPNEEPQTLTTKDHNDSAGSTDESLECAASKQSNANGNTDPNKSKSNKNYIDSPQQNLKNKISIEQQHQQANIKNNITTLCLRCDKLVILFLMLAC
jgi:hypothetical protein